MVGPGVEVTRVSGLWRVTRPWPPGLRPFVYSYDGYWDSLSWPYRVRLVPTGRAVVVISLAEPFTQVRRLGAPGSGSGRIGSLITGLDDVPGLCEHAGGQEAIRVELTPLGAYRLFAMPMSELTNQVVELRDVLGPEARVLVERLEATRDWAARFDLLDTTNGYMNQSHLTHLASPAWALTLRTELLPWLEQAADLGEDVLEIGPGPGLTTDLLLELTTRVTAVEIDPDLAAQLRARLAGSHAEVIHGDVTALELAPNRFSAATCFSMLHHMDSPQAQDQLFERLHRLLRPGAPLLGIDSIDSERIRHAHTDDTYVPVDPATLDRRLRTAGFTDTTVTRHNEYQFRFTARKPLERQV